MAESDKNVKFMVYDYLKSVDEKVAAKFKKSQKLDLEKRPGDKRSLLSVIQRVKELDRYVFLSKVSLWIFYFYRNLDFLKTFFRISDF